MQSLTPHEDAARRACASIPPVADPVSAAIARSANFAVIESSKLMDQGLGSNATLTFAASVAVSIIDSIIDSAASNYDGAEAAKASSYFRLTVLDAVAHGVLTRTSLTASALSETGAVEPGRA